MQIDWDLVSEETLNSIDLDSLSPAGEAWECRSYGEALCKIENDASWNGAQRASIAFAKHVLLMSLQADDVNAPYTAMVVYNDGRSALPSDFDKKALLRLQPWAATLKSPELRARFLDVTWVQARHFLSACDAVRAYLDAALFFEDPDQWPPCYARLARAVRLAASLGKGAERLRSEALDCVAGMLDRHPGTDPLYLSLRLIKLLNEFKHGNPADLALIAQKAAASASADNNFWRAKDYYDVVAECYRIAQYPEDANTAAVKAAESLVSEALLARTQPGRGNIVAASLISDAIELMRQIPGGRSRATALHAELLDLQTSAMGEMKPISTSTNIQKLVGVTTEAVKGQSLTEAIIRLCKMARPPTVKELQDFVYESARANPLSAMAPVDVVNGRGRVIAIVPGLSDAVTDPTDRALRWRMFQTASRLRSLAVQARFEPARSVIIKEHSPTEHHINDLVKDSPCIPPGHLGSVVRALHAGLQGDWLVVGHIAPPQFEAIVRHMVESIGGPTSMLAPGGVQPERTLGVLLESKEMQKLFGVNGVLELQDLLTDDLGANLRNEVAHGLVPDEGMFNTEVIYLWWLMLRVCCAHSYDGAKRH